MNSIQFELNLILIYPQLKFKKRPVVNNFLLNSPINRA